MSSPSAGTAIAYSNADISFGSVDLNPADEPGQNIYTGNYICVRVNNGLVQLVTPAQYLNLVNQGYDVDIVKGK